MTEDQLFSLLELLSGEDSAAPAKIARKLAIGQSQLYRMLAALGAACAARGTPNLVEVQGEEQPRLRLTDSGRAWLEQRRVA